MSDAINSILNDILRVDNIEEAFSCFLIDSPDTENAKKEQWLKDLSNIFKSFTQEQTETALRHFLTIASTASTSRLELLLELVEKLMRNGTLSSRLVCELVITSDKLTYHNCDYWLGCFGLLRRNIELVEYKGVREILKGCCEKAKTFPRILNAGLQPLIKELIDMTELITNRDACLSPGYLLVNELQKQYTESPHWRLSGLFSDYIGSFRDCAQMVSIIGHSQMRPVVEHSGCPEHLVNPWKLDPVTLRFSLKGTLPYEPELLEKQTGLLRYVLKQPYSRDMVCGMLGLQKQHKQHCAALEEQLVELVVHAMERSEVETDENATQGLWLHLSSQLIYFVLFQFSSFPNIVLAFVERLQGKLIYLHTYLKQHFPISILR